MGKLTHSMFSAPVMPKKPAQEPDVVIEDLDEGPITLDDVPVPEPVINEPPEPELVVDDDLKTYVQELTDSIGLNARGKMWLYQKICGKPFAKWEKLSDQEWRDAFRIVQGILDQAYEVPDEYILGLVQARTIVDPSEPTPRDYDTDAIQTVFPGAEVTRGKS